MQSLIKSVDGVVDATNKFTRLRKSCGEKGQHGH